MNAAGRAAVIGCGVLLALALPSAARVVRATPTVSGSASQAPRVKVSDVFSPADVARSRGYRGPRYTFAFGSMVMSLVVVLGLGLGPGSRLSGRTAVRIAGDRWWLQALMLAVGLTLVLATADLPFAIGSYRHALRWGLSTQSWSGFFSDIARGSGFQMVLLGLLAVGGFAVVRWMPTAWPIALGAGAVVVTIGLSMLWPVIYEPLFNRFTPLPPERAALRASILSLAEQAHVKVGSILVADASKRTTAENAYVSGLGATKRVVLYDTLLAKSSEREIELVVAHEFGHVRRGDVLIGTLIGAFGAFGSVLVLWRVLSSTAVRAHLGVSGAGDPRVLPFVLALGAVAALLVLPAANAYSRAIEARADRFAIALTRDPATAIDLEVSLARSNIADLEPNGFIRWAFFTHPSTMERIQAALDEKTRLGR